MGQGYQDRDHEIIDYELYNRPELGRPLRGPEPGNLEPGKFMAFVGAAQTFGCYAPEPYPALVGQAIGREVLNLGVAGAGPTFFTTRLGFMDLTNQSAVAVVQVLSGRSVSNSRLQSQGGELLTRTDNGETQGAAPAYRKLLRELSPDEIDALVNETQHNWIQGMQHLLRQIAVPTVLIWFSTRTPEYAPEHSSVEKLFGDFPQFIQRPMVDELIPLANEFVEVVTSEGLPQPLTSRFSGEPAGIRKRPDLGGDIKQANDYYPSPEMHRAAAKALVPVCERLLGGGTQD